MTGPTTDKQRHLILDLLRGLALMGIALANFPEFALWTFLSSDEQAAMTTASIDNVVRYVQFLLVDGKFYSIFSMLFGIGFALILIRHGRRLFVRRMLILMVIGFLHLMFIWSGDILLLYAVGGLLMALFVGHKGAATEDGWDHADRVLLTIAVALILLPVGLDALTEFCGVDFAGPFYDAWWLSAAEHGINEQNFASWLRDADGYGAMFDFLVQGAHERMWEFVEGHRLPKVVGLFILGYIAGRHRLYARLPQLPLRRWLAVMLVVGLPTSVLYACSATGGRPWGLTVHSLLYAVSVVPLALAMVCAVCLLYLRWSTAAVYAWIASAGHMALSCYISQSLIGIVLFYGFGFGLGTTMGLTYVELTALAAFLFEVVCCRVWLHYFNFGFLEWVWRMLTYGRYFPLKK